MSDDLRSLIADLRDATEEALPEVRKVVAKGALNVKDDWRRRWEGHPHIRALPGAISYDTAVEGDTASAEIGPDKARTQGPLGNLIEFGSVHNAPIPGGLPALAAEEPRFEAALMDLAEKLLEQR